MVNGNSCWEFLVEGFYMMIVFLDIVVSYIWQYNLEVFFFFYLVYIVLYWLIYVLEEDVKIFEECYLVGWDEIVWD